MAKQKNEIIKHNGDKKQQKINTLSFCKNKIDNFQRMITDTLLITKNYKAVDLITTSDYNTCVQNIEDIFKRLDIMKHKTNDSTIDSDLDNIITELQQINNELSSIFRTNGTKNITDVISVAMGNEFCNELDNNDPTHIYDAIKTYVHPISYVVFPWKGNDQNKSGKQIIAKNKIVEDFMIVERSNNFDCFDLARTSRDFQKKVYGIKVAIHNKKEKKTIIISGIFDDILTECVSNTYINNKLIEIFDERPTDPDFQCETFTRFVKILTIKELLIYNKEELYQRFIGYINQTNLIKQKPISQNIREFVGSDLYDQRKTLIQLLLKNNDPEFQYLAYLLYDLLSNDSNGSIDTAEQSTLFDSMPWNIKRYFKDAMKTTIDYTQSLSNFENSKIPIEQQICLLKASDSVKEKAMVKLKEVKAKSEDSGSKAKQFLDGLLKIPFGIYKKEPLLFIMDEIKQLFIECSKHLETLDTEISLDRTPDSIKITSTFRKLEDDIIPKIKSANHEQLLNLYTSGKRPELVDNICYINTNIKKGVISANRICHSGTKNSIMKNRLSEFIKTHKDNDKIIHILQKRYKTKFKLDELKEVEEKLSQINIKWDLIGKEINEVNTKLEASVHGHDNAKRQLQRIIGQWINGESDGYAFGFEGPPGVGKTSLAKKGLAGCLKDENGESRPVAFIAIGGSSNGSTLVGHNYTYVGSTWGKIVDILIEKKCMNPIIIIDELDKVSRSEHGKEIIGILTHLSDETQNNTFQDKYFTGIDLDLSKALWIFSYNDPASIDKILLDRIHRVKFDDLSLEDKIVIVKNYILPEIYKKLGLKPFVKFSDEIIVYIIESYTYEPGVRKLKEILYEILSEINLEVLQANISNEIGEIVITEELLKTKYLKERHEIDFTKIHTKSKVGVISGLWANSLGKGGIIPIESIYYLSNSPLESKITGLPGDVMKESKDVALPLAWKLTPQKTRDRVLKEFEKTKMQGLQVHCPDGATPKNGPSAGTAITTCIYSLLNNKKIKNTIAITGEITLQGQVTKIGGLKLKILGGIRAGVKEFIFPKENEKDFDKFMEEYASKPIVKDIIFHKVSTIDEVFKLVFV
jgi:ATP-dependent Lon protease